MENNEVDFDHTKRIQERGVETAIKAIFAQLHEQEIDLNGIKAKIKIFYPPKLDPKERSEESSLYGKWSFGIDVSTPTGHLEFIMYQAGWGGSPIAKIKEVTPNG